MNLKQVLFLTLGIVLCIFWVFIITPGSRTGGEFYPWPVDDRLVGVWVIGWCVILVPILWILRKPGKK
jgi:hypothetical protein